MSNRKVDLSDADRLWHIVQFPEETTFEDTKAIFFDARGYGYKERKRYFIPVHDSSITVHDEDTLSPLNSPLHSSLAEEMTSTMSPLQPSNELLSQTNSSVDVPT